ncbi:MAG: lipopolysaccharide biosynthesis protein [Geminicoccaceae bacterium]
MFELAKRLVPRGRLGKAVATLAGGTAAGQFLVVLASPLITRLFTPEQFGALGVFGALLGILAGAICLRYEVAVTVEEQDDRSINLLALSVLVALILSGGVALIVLTFGEAVGGMLNSPLLVPWLWLLPLATIFAGTYRALSYWSIRKKQFNRVAATKVAQPAGQVVVHIAAGLAQFGVAGLLFGQVVGQSAGISTLARPLLSDASQILRAISLKGMMTVAWLQRRFPLFSSWANLLHELSRWSPALFLAAFYGAEVAGWFALAQRVMGTPMRFVGNAIARVFLAEAPTLMRNDAKKLRRLFTRITVRLLAMGGLIAAIVLVAGPGLCALVFGQAWIETGYLMQMLVPIYLSQLIASPTSQTLIVFNRQPLQLLWDVIRVATVAGSFVLGHWMAWDWQMTVLIYSLGTAGCYALLFWLAFSLIRNHAHPAPDLASGG